MSRILGAVLAGGRSRRFGADKAHALLDGQSLLDRAIAQLAGLTESVVVCGRRLDGADWLDDAPRAGLGPLGGLLAALDCAAARGFDGVLSTACDMPLFPAPLAHDLTRSGAAVTAGHHLAGHWPADLAPVLRRHLQDCPDRSMHAWIGVARPRRVVWPAGLPNINTREALIALESDWRVRRTAVRTS